MVVTILFYVWEKLLEFGWGYLKEMELKLDYALDPKILKFEF
jgi:hypothetical protein